MATGLLLLYIPQAKKKRGRSEPSWVVLLCCLLCNHEKMPTITLFTGYTLNVYILYMMYIITHWPITKFTWWGNYEP